MNLRTIQLLLILTLISCTESNRIQEVTEITADVTCSRGDQVIYTALLVKSTSNEAFINDWAATLEILDRYYNHDGTIECIIGQ